MQSTKTSTPKIHYFNPGSEAAVPSRNVNHTPTAPVRKMMADLALLPLWYGENGDYVFVENIASVSRYLSNIPNEISPLVKLFLPTEMPTSTTLYQPLEAAPWGISPQSVRFFERLKQQCLPALVAPTWNDKLAELIHRRTAAECLQQLATLTDRLTPPQFASNIDDILRFMQTHAPPFIIKMPYSCSGRGICRIQDKQLTEQARCWINGAIHKQQSVSIETALDNVCDFAMEFESHGNGQVDFKGLSVFETSAAGAYNGNLLDNSVLLAKNLAKYISESSLDKVRMAVQHTLGTKIGAVYKGFLGVDMLVYRKGSSFAIHPFIEINLRQTMGHVSLQLVKKWIHPDSKGRFVVSCQKEGRAYRTHLQRQDASPLLIADGKIRSVYFPLCPVAADTMYSAYVVVERRVSSIETSEVNVHTNCFL